MDPKETFASIMARADEKEKKRQHRYRTMRKRGKPSKVMKAARSESTLETMENRVRAMEIEDARIKAQRN